MKLKKTKITERYLNKNKKMKCTQDKLDHNLRTKT